MQGTYIFFENVICVDWERTFTFMNARPIMQNHVTLPCVGPPSVYYGDRPKANLDQQILPSQLKL